MDGFAAVDFEFARQVLQRGIAALYLVAFLSTLNQFRPLLGEHGLLPAPEVRGRTGYYGPEHVSRVELIRELQTEGFNLEAIRKLLEGADGSSNEVLRFTRAVREPFEVGVGGLTGAGGRCVQKMRIFPLVGVRGGT